METQPSGCLLQQAQGLRHAIADANKHSEWEELKRHQPYFASDGAHTVGHGKHALGLDEKIECLSPIDGHSLEGLIIDMKYAFACTNPIVYG